MPLSVAIPRAVQLVIDDVGWREGWSLDASWGPWRAGVRTRAEWYGAQEERRWPWATLLQLEVYGRQGIAVRLPVPPVKVVAANPRVKLDGVTYDRQSQAWRVCLAGHGIHGEGVGLTIAHGVA